ncbi:MAG: phosphohydrolase [Alphaproteobacteria bacterium]|nr:phosphohydrolase [Alphaproteobacteria bacterium]
MANSATTSTRVKLDERSPLPRERTPLGDPTWRYVGASNLEGLGRSDWEIIERQRGVFFKGRAARDALALLDTQKDDPSYGYHTNMYRHCLESATRAWRDGGDEEFIVICLLHDIGFTIANATHGEFAAALLRPYVDEAHYWMLRHHQQFQAYHCHDVPGGDRMKREQYRGHPAFELTARFVANYDQNTTDANYDTMPIEAFVPLVHRFFERTPKP